MLPCGHRGYRGRVKSDGKDFDVGDLVPME